ESIAKQILVGGPSPNLGEGVEPGGRVWHPRKSSVLGQICLLEPKRYLSPLTSQSQNKFSLREPSPNLGEGIERGGRRWHPSKVLRIRSNLFAGTETLSLSVNEPIAKQIFVAGTVPNLGR